VRNPNSTLDSTPNLLLLRAAAWLAVLIWAGTIHWFSSRTGPEIEEMNVFELSDKAAHFLAFFAGAPALVCALRWTFDGPWKKIIMIATLALALYGAVDEYHQTFTPNRTGADVFDWLGDALGGIAGVFATRLVYARFTRPADPRPAAPARD
jgi:VanZ family protein